MPKFYNDSKAILDEDLYYEVFQKKGVKFLRIRLTKDFSNLSGKEFEILTEHVWTQGDTYWRLSHGYYNQADLWWTIAIVNGKPTDAHCEVGDTIMIPRNPYLIAEAMR